MCKQRFYRWGSPDDRAIPKSWYDSERERYTRLISDELHRTKLVKMALSFCSTYLSKSLEGTQYRANPSGYVTQLAKAGLEAEEMLIEAISMYAFCTRRKRLPQYQVGNAVLRMKRWSPKAVRGIHRREVGGYLIQHLQPFFTALMEYESPQDRFRDALEKAAKEELGNSTK